MEEISSWSMTMSSSVAESSPRMSVIHTSMTSSVVVVAVITLFLALVSTSLGATVSSTTAPGSLFVLPWRRGIPAGRGASTSWYKGWSGLRVPPGMDGDRTIVTMLYYHEQTIAVVELGKAKTLRNCELIEVYEPYEATDALRNLTFLGRPLEISFYEMMQLMDHCSQLQLPSLAQESAQEQRITTRMARGFLENTVANPTAIFNGIVPGTKWCGTGDIANTYYDLGMETTLDKCCRAHDLCPVKIRAYQTRYNLTNSALFSKSHCECDNVFYRCLKNCRSSTADVLGNIYFNIVQVPCLEHALPPAAPSGQPGVEPMCFTDQQYEY